MDRRIRTLIVVGVAVVAAAVASATVYSAVKRIPVREVEVAHTFIVIATRPLSLGTRLTDADVKRISWPASSPLPSSFTGVEEVVGRGLVTAVSENEPILESKLAPRDAGAGLSPAIPPGMRAISVKVNEVIGVAGFAVPGARVDVVATVRHPNDAVARVLVANVPVLTAGTRYDQERSREAKPIPSTVVTLVVTPAQAEKIALAETEGQITLMLRNPIDVAEPLTPGARLARLVDEGTIIPPSSAPTAPPKAKRQQPSTAEVQLQSPTTVPNTAPPAAYTVEAIRAGKRTQEIVQ